MRPTPTPESRPVPPLFKADKGTIAFAALPDGKVRLIYASWDDAKVVPTGSALELTWGKQGVEGRIIARVEEPEPDVDPFWIPDDPRAPRAEWTALTSSRFSGPRPPFRPDGIPSRADQSLMSPAELAITEAMAVVERAGASIALTDAVVFLSRARERVADHVEARPELPQQEKPDDAGPRDEPASTGGASEGAAG